MSPVLLGALMIVIGGGRCLLYFYLSNFVLAKSIFSAGGNDAGLQHQPG
jgi:hypothetical protein